MTYRRNIAREMIELIVALELERDRLVIVVEDLLEYREGARLRAAILVDDIKGENRDV